MEDTINIEGLDRAAVLAALYNASRPLGMGFMHYDATPMSVEEARQLLGPEPVKSKYFDYLKGRVMKLEMGGTHINTRLYDRDNGPGAAAKVIADLRATNNTFSTTIQESHRIGVQSAVEQVREVMDTPTTEGVGEIGGLKVATINMGLDDVKDKLEPKVNKAAEENQ